MIGMYYEDKEGRERPGEICEIERWGGKIRHRVPGVLLIVVDLTEAARR